MQAIAASLAVLATAVATAASAADPLPRIDPEKAGFSREGLERIDRFFEREIAADRVPGAVVAIARDGKLVYYKAFGYLDKAAGTRMPLDAMFQLASMTKPMVSVGGLVLYEEGRLPMKARLDQYFPGFAKMQVGIVGSGSDAKPEAAKPIFIHDLYRHTSGLVYGGRGESPVHAMYPVGSSPTAAQYSGDEFIAKMTSLPLLHQPGTVWEYSFSFEVLGLVIEKVAGRTLGEHLKAAIWDKVGMPDTSFRPTEAQRKRVAQPLPNDPVTGKPQRIASHGLQPKFDCGGGCAWGTVGDYVRFGQMLLDGGSFEGRRVLGPKTVAWMASDHLGTAIKNQVAGTEPQRDGYGFGLGVMVRVVDGVAAVPGSIGDYSWNGANGTGWWNDPKERLVVVFGTAAPGEIRKYYREQVGALVYGAMTKPR